LFMFKKQNINTSQISELTIIRSQFYNIVISEYFSLSGINYARIRVSFSLEIDLAYSQINKPTLAERYKT
ncbi:hypothetical protein QUG96_18975, partial [Klebsiella michiganensis]|uniref:hypothetical protein n=1 Tax=Klebsiella michiganensis TaxID=1134687 RepID=UPI0025A0003B